MLVAVANKTVFALNIKHQVSRGLKACPSMFFEKAPLEACITLSLFDTRLEKCRRFLKSWQALSQFQQLDVKGIFTDSQCKIL